MADEIKDQATNDQTAGSENNADNEKSNPMRDLRNDNKKTKKENADLKNRISILEAKTTFGGKWEDALKMRNGGMDDESIKKYLSSTTEADPQVEVDESELGIKSLTPEETAKIIAESKLSDDEKQEAKIRKQWEDEEAENKRFQ